MRLSEGTFRGVWCGLAAASVIGVCEPGQAANPPASECLAASHAAIRADNEHRLRSERTELLLCAAAGCPADIRKECIRRVDEINLLIPTIVFDAKDAAGNELSAVKVIMDGEVLTERLEGIALSIDPGVHNFTFEVGGLPSVQKRFIIRERQKDRTERVTFDAATPAPPLAQPKPVVAHPLPPPPAPPEEASRSAANKVFTILATGVGVAGLSVGTVFGLQARSQRDEASKACPRLCPDGNGVKMWHDAKTAGNLSTIGFIVGGAGLAFATVFWLAGKPEPVSAPSAEVGFGLGEFSVRGRW
jgi:hypothetical protein